LHIVAEFQRKCTLD